MRLKLHEIAALCAPRAGNSTEPPLEEEQEEYQDVMPYQPNPSPNPNPNPNPNPTRT